MAAARFGTIPRQWEEIVFLGCWLSTAATGAAVHLRKRPGVRTGLLLSINAGLWASGVVALSGAPPDLLKAIPAILVILPSSWLIGRGGSIVVKVVSSWLIAIAILVAALPFTSETPGYLPDHLE
jgi:hypothetical protein